MPTGYTAILLDEPNTTFRQFALRCLRAFGAPDEIPSSTHYSNALNDAKEKLERFTNLSSSEQYLECGKQIHSQITELMKGKEQQQKEAKIFTEMIEKVNLYVPPTKEHIGLKDFMLQQLKESNSYNLELSYYDNEIEKLKKLSFDVWKANEILRLDKDVNYYQIQQQKEEARTKEINEWIRALKNSLDQYEQVNSSR